jgi:hypothetical protein
MHLHTEFYAMKISLSKSKFKLSVILFLALIATCSYGQENYISISKGGGFTGSATVYKLHANGDLFKGQGLGDISFTEKSGMKSCARKKFFKRAESLIKETSSHPGNIYYSITFSQNGKATTITWGAEGHTPKDDVKKLYDDLFAKIQTLKFSATK